MCVQLNTVLFMKGYSQYIQLQKPLMSYIVIKKHYFSVYLVSQC